jgi:hypothetical protein
MGGDRHLHDAIAQAVFATHYHELTQLADELTALRNLNVAVREAGEQILFLHRLEPGGADRSYGIEVGRLAGLPTKVIQRARQVLALLEGEQLVRGLDAPPGGKPAPPTDQLGLFASTTHPVVEQLAPRRREHADAARGVDALGEVGGRREAALTRLAHGKPRCAGHEPVSDWTSPTRRCRSPPLLSLPRLATYFRDDDVLGLIGWTPLIRLSRVTRGIRTPVFAKAEFFNPGGSLKDRIGLPVIERAEREGRLKPGGTIVEGTSGNTGIGLAIAAAFKGYKCVFTMPDKMSQEKVRLLKAFGAEVIVTPTAVPPDHPDNYVMMAKRIASETPNAILANQFYNDANSQAHYDTTGPEIWEQTQGQGDALCARRRHWRNDHGRQSLSPKRIRRFRSSRAIRWFDSLRHVAVERREQAGGRPLQSRRHRAGQGPRHARHERRRRFHDRERQGVLRDGAAPHSRRGTVRRRIERARGSRRAARRAARRRPERADRRAVAGHGRALSLQALQ